MMIYFEFEDRRYKADVTWPKERGSIVVHLLDSTLTRVFPPDLFFEIDIRNKVVFTAENPDNKRLISLQDVIKRRLQELSH